MKKIYTVGNVRGITFLIYGQDHSCVDVAFYHIGTETPFYSKNFFSKNKALDWVDYQLAKIAQNY